MVKVKAGIDNEGLFMLKKEAFSCKEDAMRWEGFQSLNRHTQNPRENLKIPPSVVHVRACV